MKTDGSERLTFLIRFCKSLSEWTRACKRAVLQNPQVRWVCLAPSNLSILNTQLVHSSRQRLLSHALHAFKSSQNILVCSNTHLIPHTYSVPHLFCSIPVPAGYSTSSPRTPLFHDPEDVSILLPHTSSYGFMRCYQNHQFFMILFVYV